MNGLTRTPDGRYFVLKGKSGPRLRRATNPNLSEADRVRLSRDLMLARRAVRAARGEKGKVAAARREIEEARQALGERGAPWWHDGAPDLNRRLVKNSPYQDWWTEHPKGKRRQHSS
jgi:hypothetical protein